MLQKVLDFFSRKQFELQQYDEVVLGDGRKYIVDRIDLSIYGDKVNYAVSFARADGIGFVTKHYGKNYVSEHEINKIISVNGVKL